MPALISRMRRFGTTIFAEMSALAREHDAINLGQGFPDTDGPSEVLAAAVAGIESGDNQYPPGRGVPELLDAIAAHQEHYYGLRYDPATEILVTVGATEALSASLLALCEPGDEVIAFEPFYDVYDAAITLAGATLVPVRLEAPAFTFDPAALEAAVTERTKVILLNTPHNPTGHVFAPEELRQIADVAVRHDLVVITDEVYEHLTFDGREHAPIATLPGMRERSILISSGGKTFATTGWKVGWVCASPELVTAVTTVKQFLTFVGPAPMQRGIGAGLRLPDARIAEIRDGLQRQRDVLVEALEGTGMHVHVPEGGYFIVADVAPLGVTSAIDFCRELPERVGVTAVPLSVFYRDTTGVETLVRFAFSKRIEVLEKAAGRLAALGTSS
ncbi:pyridoxal phosphate-dependent aminotransferase [Gulosibacter sp. ACHW.36C]|uniref:Pyridoxal phosphate-dependent aminotransferase n=1 Tax=Gulosibacter sediminis TaxID=1729695 RepID=A0ABY4MZH2_9MICO|nr:pyridoxal phosphate-dependent aminotransferase [Gulosibacter sediminis]UQN15789.1 pyridoxal phosphate-dependent aminotransferase [Gulosibacter sediminis]